MPVYTSTSTFGEYYNQNTSCRLFLKKCYLLYKIIQDFFTDSKIQIYINPNIYLMQKLTRPLFPKLGKYIDILRGYPRFELSGYILYDKAMGMGTLFLFLFPKIQLTLELFYNLIIYKTYGDYDNWIFITLISHFIRKTCSNRNCDK